MCLQAQNAVKFGVHIRLANGHPIYDQILIPRNWSKVKLRRAILLWYGLNGVKFAQNVMNSTCTLAYEMYIQINDQI